MSEPITLLQCQNRVNPKIQECIAIIEHYFGRTMPTPTVEWFGITKGKAAGMAKFINGHYKLLINQKMMAENLDDYVNTAVPHEMAHLAAWFLYGTKVKPHGKEWKSIMGLFGAVASTQHTYNTAGVQQTYLYRCDCPDRELQLTTRQHNAQCTGKKNYVCRFCKQPIRRHFPSV